MFTHEKVLYTYGFLVSSRRVHEEWLFAHLSRSESRMFERTTTEEGTTEVAVGEAMGKSREEQQFVRFVAKGTRPNQLFLTEAFDRNVEKLGPVYRWFRDQLVVVNPDAEYFALSHRVHEDDDFVSFLGRFLKNADTGIEGIHTEEEELDVEELPASILETLRNRIERDLASSKSDGGFYLTSEALFTTKRSKDGKTTIVRLLTEHVGDDGQKVQFEIEDESDGTRRLLHLAPILRDLAINERTYFVDELDRSLHPELCRSFVQAFLRMADATPVHGQLVVTLHDVGVLDEKAIRKDEIWFVDKQRGESQLYSLSEFDVRNDLRRAKAYRAGRFGAVPRSDGLPGTIDSLLDTLGAGR